MILDLAVTCVYDSLSEFLYLKLQLFDLPFKKVSDSVGFH